MGLWIFAPRVLPFYTPKYALRQCLESQSRTHNKSSTLLPIMIWHFTKDEEFLSLHWKQPQYVTFFAWSLKEKYRILFNSFSPISIWLLQSGSTSNILTQQHLMLWSLHAHLDCSTLIMGSYKASTHLDWTKLIMDNCGKMKKLLLEYKPCSSHLLHVKNIPRFRPLFLSSLIEHRLSWTATQSWIPFWS